MTRMPARTQALRIALWGAAVLIAFWAAADPRFRGPAGNLHALSILPFALAASLAVLATTLAGEWKLAGRWSAVGLIGQAVTLQLITAGPVVGYHDYKNMLAEFTNGRVFSAAALADAERGAVALGGILNLFRKPELGVCACPTANDHDRQPCVVRIRQLVDEEE